MEYMMVSTRLSHHQRRLLVLKISSRGDTGDANLPLVECDGRRSHHDEEKHWSTEVNTLLFEAITFVTSGGIDWCAIPLPTTSCS
jgi:hypothetical protein